MSLINHEELKKQLASGEITSLDDITAEFKNILKEVIQTASQKELTSHLGYDKYQKSSSSNARNGYNKKTIKHLFKTTSTKQCFLCSKFVLFIDND